MKALLPFSAICLCTALTHTASAAAAQNTSPSPPVPSQDQTQTPAPIVRPRAARPKPAPQPDGATGGAVLIEPIRPHPAAPASPANGSTGLTTQRARPAASAPTVNSAAGSTGVLAKKAIPPKPATLPGNTAALPAKVQPAGTAAVPFNRTTIVLDPAHGGVDGGSRITDTLQEKDVDLAFAFKLRSLLTARGFNVVLTRDNDTASPTGTATPLSLDDRAGTANHTHPVACLLLHSTASGKGVHLYSSELTPIPLEPPVVPWLTAQAPWVNSSRALQKELGTALNRAGVPLVLSRASIRPLDSLACPALVLELAPEGSDKESVSDGSYQQQVANALASALVFWQTQAQAPDRQLPAPPVTVTPSPVPTPSSPGDQP